MKRRGRGEGSIFRRKDGTWCGIFDVGIDERGRRRRRSVYGATKAEVLEKLTRLRAQALSGDLANPERVTVGAFLTRWLESHAAAIRESTRLLYAGALARHVLPRIGGLRLDRLGPVHVQGLLADLERAGVGAPMRAVVYRACHRALRQAVSWRLLSRNPAEGVVRPREAAREMQTWTPEQAGRFLAVAAGERLGALYALLLGTGLRLGEALGLAWADVDLRAGTATIRRQLSEVRNRLSFTEPKTQTARRTVDLPAFVAEALRAHEERMGAEGHLLNDQLLVFVDSEGHPLRRSNIRRRSFEPLLRRAGLPRVRLHDLRHTAATLHLRNGVHPKVVQQLLGHARVSITLDTYSHAVPGMGREAAARLDELLSSGRRLPIQPNYSLTGGKPRTLADDGGNGEAPETRTGSRS